MISPVQGSTLTGASVTFTWSAGTGAAAYWLDVGTAQGQGDIFNQNVSLVTSKTVNGIPTDGSTVYVKLWTLLAGTWQSGDYTYKSGGALAKAVMLLPTPSSVLGGAGVAFHVERGFRRNRLLAERGIGARRWQLLLAEHRAGNKPGGD